MYITEIILYLSKRLDAFSSMFFRGFYSILCFVQCYFLFQWQGNASAKRWRAASSRPETGIP